VPLLRHISIPFERIASERDLPMRGIIPSGTFLTRRPRPALGWEEAGMPVPEISVRRARILYNRGDIVPTTGSGVPAADPAASESGPSLPHVSLGESAEGIPPTTVSQIATSQGPKHRRSLR
jgi:hypothetical protein